MSLWIIKGSDFVDALKQAFEKHDRANQDYLMAEFNIADHGVTRRQRWQFIDDPPNEEIFPKTVNEVRSRPVLKIYRKTATAHPKSET
jgi:hypothetical protein